MEKWQQVLIKRKLPELIDLTSCNTGFLTQLCSEDILSEEEFHEIDGIQNPKRKARKFYEIIATREHGYNLLLHACIKTKQTGVVSILKDGERVHQLNKSDELNVAAPITSTKKDDIVLDSNFDTNLLLETSGTVNTYSDQNIPISVFPVLTQFEPPGITSMNPFSCNAPFFLSENNFEKNLPKESISRPYGNISSSNEDKDFSLTNSDMEVKRSQSRCCDKAAPDKEHPYTLKYDTATSQISDPQADNEGRTTLHQALLDGKSLNIIKNLIDLKADYKMKDKCQEGALHLAVRGGDKEVMSFLLSLKLDINDVDDHGETPLHKVGFTKSRDYWGTTKYLLDNGADLCAYNWDRNNVAHLLAIDENITSDYFESWVQGMTHNGHSNVFAFRNKFGKTPLEIVMERLDLDLITTKLMLDYTMVDTDNPDEKVFTLLLLALSFGRSVRTIKNLIQLGADMNLKDKKESGVLHFAVIGGNKQVIKYLITEGLDVNAKNYDGDKPLHFVKQTKQKNYIEITKLLVDCGADLYSVNRRGYTIAHGMALWNDVSCDDFKLWATAMIQNGHARLFSRLGGIYWTTPLYFAMQRLDLDFETLKLIIESSKNNINQLDDRQNALLHLAITSGRSVDTIRSLVQLGADWKLKDMYGRSVMHYAVERSNQEAFLYFKEAC